MSEYQELKGKLANYTQRGKLMFTSIAGISQFARDFNGQRLKDLEAARIRE